MANARKESIGVVARSRHFAHRQLIGQKHVRPPCDEPFVLEVRQRFQIRTISPNENRAGNTPIRVGRLSGDERREVACAVFELHFPKEAARSEEKIHRFASNRLLKRIHSVELRLKTELRHAGIQNGRHSRKHPIFCFNVRRVFAFAREGHHAEPDDGRARRAARRLDGTGRDSERAERDDECGQEHPNERRRASSA